MAKQSTFGLVETSYQFLLSQTDNFIKDEMDKENKL